MVTILIVDDHPAFRKGLRQILESYNENITVTEAGNGQEVLSKLLRHKYDLIFLDISMPGRNGLEVLQDVKQFNSEANVIILSMHSEDRYAVRAMKGGASGYLTKDSDPKEFIKALEKVLSGNTYFSVDTMDKLLSGFSQSPEMPPHEKLSDREYEIMRQIATGKKLIDIANELAISLSAVSTHRSRVLKKIGISNNAQIVRYAINHELID